MNDTTHTTNTTNETIPMFPAAPARDVSHAVERDGPPPRIKEVGAAEPAGSTSRPLG
jgi:hypothetical protein